MNRKCLSSLWVWGILLAVNAQAGSLEFRSDGFFASPDARVKLFRESWSHAPHLDVDGKLAVTLVGPILRPGYATLSQEGLRTEIDPARRQMIESGMTSQFSVPCRRTMVEYAGGLLFKMEYGETPPGVSDVACRLIFPIDFFQNHRVRWPGGEMVFPALKPETGRMVFRDLSKGSNTTFRFDLGEGRELGVKFLTPLRGGALADCREWNERNYHLQTTFSGKTMVLFLCLLAPGDTFPEVELPAESPAPGFSLSEEGASLLLGQGLYNMVIGRSGKLSVTKLNKPLYTIEPPFIREKQSIYPLTEVVSFKAASNRLEVVSKAKEKPFQLHQTYTAEANGWVSVAAEMVGSDAKAADTRVELALPVELFAGKTIRAGERFINFPREQAPSGDLFDDWAGKVVDYEFPGDGLDRAALICDLKAQSYLSDYRQWGQTSYKLGLRAKEGMVRYRLHFWREAVPPPVSGNLLRDANSFEVGPEGVQPFSCFSWTEKMVGAGPPPVFDSATSVHGKTSLRLTAGDSVKQGNAKGFAFVGAVFNRVALKRDRRYTVSAYLKSDRPGMKAVLYCGETSWAGNDWQAFPVTTEWKRYQFSFYTGDFKKTGYYLTWVGLDPALKEGSLWVDAVQLEEGDLTDFQPASEAEYGVEVLSKEKLFESGTACKVALRVRNNTDQRRGGKVSYVIKDYWEQEVKKGEVELGVADGFYAERTVDFGALPCGYYRGYFTVPGGAVKEAIFGVYRPQPLSVLPDDWPLACHNDPAPLVRKLGFGSVRAFEIFEFNEVAREQGKFDFTRTDRMVEQAERCGLTLMPILGSFEWPSYSKEPRIPVWAQEKVGRSSVPDARHRVTWPKLELWKAYVKALTGRYKGRIRYWEVLNEPNLYMTAQEYLPYLRAAYEGAKEGDPDCKVVGVCATSDFAGKPGSFTEAVLKLGGAAYFDVLSVHLYNTKPPETTLDAGSDRLLENWRKSLRATYKKEAVIWHTERSFNCRQLAYSVRKVNVPLEYCDEPQFLVDTFKQKAEYMIRETLLDSVSGKGGRFFWFGVFNSEVSFISNRYFQPYGLDHSEFDQSPCPELLAANGLARVLTGRAHPFRLLAWGDAERGCVFTGEQGSVIALWNWKGRSQLMLKAGKNKPELKNFFGEPLVVSINEEGDFTVELEGAPKYLILSGLDGEAACRWLDQKLKNANPR